MRLIYTPQRADIDCAVAADGETLTVTVQGQADTFDFSGMPDGEAEGIESSLPYNPVIAARRQSGELTVTLIRWHGAEPVYQAPAYDPPPYSPPMSNPPAAELPGPIEGETEAEYAARFEQAEADHAEALQAYGMAFQAELDAYEQAYASATGSYSAAHQLEVEAAQAAHAAAHADWLASTQIQEVTV